MRPSHYRITCNSSRRPQPKFYSPNGTLSPGGVTQHEHLVALEMNRTTVNTFQNRDMYCDDNERNYFYLYFKSSNNSE